MATGESFRSLSFGFRISHSYISLIIKETLSVLRTKLVPIFLPDANTIDFKVKAAEFSYKWNYPNCILAIDGKHVWIRSPINSGSLFHNYKDYFSTVLLAMVDANYKFIVVDIGSYGKEGDSGIFFKSELGKQILGGIFRFPEDSALPGSNIIVPHASREDDSKKKFNYRLSRDRRVTENAFGLLSQIFRVFYQPMNINITTCDDLILVACCLHNMLRDAYMENNKRPFYELDSEQTEPTNNMLSMTRGGGFYNIEGFEVRDRFKHFFNNEGSVSWQ
ncbi:unnamed protein product [Macrosiphum euphorbiae]|uniref:DDE Tnp4 domain-containing protein n=1 Tax=Macrosiphum euphorbiae TaxID=13131 RepID=A0AAV0XV36_9HEMI|nr:unnamed protein product [Macrosiphum euphorbiae]